MANPKPTKTTLKKGDKLPPRGRAKRTLILDAIIKESLLDLDKSATRDEAEGALFGHMAKRALTIDDQNSGMILKILMDKGWASLKSNSELVNFEFSKDAKPHVQAAQVLKAASDGVIPPDIANTFISAIKSMIEIEEYTDLKDRIVKLEAALSGEA